MGPLFPCSVCTLHLCALFHVSSLAPLKVQGYLPFLVGTFYENVPTQN